MVMAATTAFVRHNFAFFAFALMMADRFHGVTAHMERAKVWRTIVAAEFYGTFCRPIVEHNG